MKQLVERYLRHLTIERGLSKNSLAAYRRDLERYTGFLAEQGIDDPASISVGDTQAFMSWLRDPDELDMSASSAARIASSVRGFHRFLDDEGVVDGDVASELKAPKQARRLPKALTIDEVQRLLDAAGGDAPEQLRDRALLEVLYASGARISEAVGLAVDDVIDRDMVRVRGKGDKQRVVPLGSYAQAALGAYLVRARPIFAAKGKGSPALFLGVRGGALSRNSAWNILQRVAERAELSTHVSPHTLRHSFATHLMQGGADVRVVQELLGHSSVSTTQIYTKVTADALREMYALAHPRAR
ncbi:site-specific tyrosine recombinase XerD [Gulosibacter faecalis]|uniref:Tyrosine recombinase XerD n=1 Tax=Gulosibacter faecalis TaxID=272240 RepID=A0ABW5V3E3_9MICO|nr:site-specific tyrosine recombinase XerD [Gulosibacter faecalis]